MNKYQIKTYERSMPFQSVGAFSALRIPNLHECIRGRRYKSLSSVIIHKGPDPLLMTSHCDSWFVCWSIPHFDALIMGGGRELFLTCWVDAQCVNRIIMSYKLNVGKI